MASLQISFDIGTPISERVEAISPIVNSMIEEHDSGDSLIGVEAFQDDLMGRIRAAGLMEKKWLKVDEVGVHPDNREKAMLVPIDMHDLLKRMAKDGWNYAKWDALACEIPSTPIWAPVEEDERGFGERVLMVCWPLTRATGSLSSLVVGLMGLLPFGPCNLELRASILRSLQMALFRNPRSARSNLLWSSL